MTTDQAPDEPTAGEPGRTVLEFCDVTVTFGRRTVLDGVSAAVAGQTLTVLTGPSGAGKTTLLRLCNRLEVPTSGRVLFKGEDLDSLDPLALRRRVGMVFQRPTLFPGTLRDNFEVARADTDAAYRLALEAVGLPPDWLDREADRLSGGEAQRACLARTLLTEPEVLLMDEPTSSLDPTATATLERLCTDLVAGGMTMLWVSHDLAQVRRIADATVVLIGGRLAGPPEAAAYLAEGPGSHEPSPGAGAERSTP
jgi:putative ABC transport system ATP-binding protein